MRQLLWALVCQSCTCRGQPQPMRVRLVRRKEDDGDLRRFTHRLHPLSWAMHDKRAVERSSQGPAVPEPRLLFLVLVGWAGLAGWRLRRQMEQREQATPSAFGQSITFPPSIFPRLLLASCDLCDLCAARDPQYTQSTMPRPLPLLGTLPPTTHRTTRGRSRMLILRPAICLACLTIQGSSLPKSRVLQGPGATSLIGGLSTGRGPHFGSRTTPAKAPTDYYSSRRPR